MAKPEATDLDLLFPERELEIRGVTVTLREYTFPQALKLHAVAEPIIDALAVAVDQDADLDLVDSLDVIAEHQDAFLHLISESCGQPVEWIEQLNEIDGTKLASVFWEVNESFFVNRLLRKVTRQQARSPSHGPPSTTA